jgi:hypothetical protein
MKSISFILFVSLLTLPSISYSQSDEVEALKPEQEQVVQVEDGDVPREIEGQEDILHPEGEVNDWSLGGEDLPAEDFD